MFKALGKLTQSTVFPASKEQIVELKTADQEKERRYLEFKKTDEILKKLKKSYSEHKRDAAPKRFKALKEMADDAITTLRRADSSENPVKGKIGNLLRSVEAFVNASSDPTTQYSENTNMSSVEVEDKISAARRETELFKNNYRLRRDILEEMDKKYKEALKLDPINRYAQVKMAVKTSIGSYELVCAMR